MAKFVCKHCNYRFESDLKNISKKCPYCENGGIVAEPSAQDLIDE